MKGKGLYVYTAEMSIKPRCLRIRPVLRSRIWSQTECFPLQRDQTESLSSLKILCMRTKIRVSTVRCYAWTMLSVCCPSVRPSVTRRYSVEAAKHILKLFSPSGSHTILVFLPHQTLWQFSDGGVESRVYEKIAIFDQYLPLSRK